jgi:phosphatidylglycerol:prolipoprotein diacylglycerol transferase
MHPTLFHIGSLGIHSYGVAIAVGFIATILLGVRAAPRQGIRVDQVLDLAFWMLVSTILGARLLYLVTEAPSYARICLGTEAPGPRGLGQILFDCSRGLHLWEGGLVFYGGLIAATLSMLWFCRRKGLSFLKVGDLVAPVAALGHFFGRLGCYGAGCCYGKPTASGLGLAFPPESMVYQEMVRGGLLDARALATPPVFPTQLYEAVGELAIYLALTLFARRKRYHGQLMLLYLTLYPILRFGLELLRADPDRHFVISLSTPSLASALGLPPELPLFLSTSQLISVLLLAVTLTLWRRLRRSTPEPT